MTVDQIIWTVLIVIGVILAIAVLWDLMEWATRWRH